MNLKKLFLNYCKKNNLEINPNQLELVDQLNDFNNLNFNKSFLNKIFSNKNSKPGFYLQGDVGVGKTMILNFFYENFKLRKQRIHFNEFMISFHDFKFKNKENKKENIIDKFVQKLKKKYELIYFDEFQVTNIVDAMILGNLFKKIFNGNIKVLFSLNIKINDFTNGFRFYSKRSIEKIVSRCGNIGDGFIILSEIIVVLNNNNFKIDEKPTNFFNRTRGESSVNLKLIVESFFGIIKLFLIKKKLY